jgi:class 3 adenylate cyclase/tetratricopeptide (TPR) repeat protein
MLLQQKPPGEMGPLTVTDPPPVPPETLVRCLSPAVRDHVVAGGGAPEHRPVAIAFLRFQGTDALILEHGADAAAEALDRLIGVVEAATEEQGIAFLASDVDADGGKLILTGGAPKGTGNDEERILLALRKIVSADLPLPVRIGIHRGAVFAGDIGPPYRRTYTVMGDAVNLTARLMAKAEPGQIIATADVLERSNTLFVTTELEPFTVKGKAEPIQAWSIGDAQGSRARQVSLQRLPLTGRNVELGVIRKAFTSARSGAGRLIEVVGDAGIGKTRLLEALRDAAAGFRKLHAACEAYTASTPYALWRELLREFMNFGRDDPDAVIAERLRDEVEKRAPDLLQWLPLIAIPFGLDLAPTPEVEMLAEKNRRARLHESISRFLAVMVPESALFEIESAHHMDEASAELLSYLTGELAARPWLFAVSRRPTDGFAAPDAPTVVRIELKPLAPQDALRMAQLATQQSPLPAHALEVVAKRSGGNPQFLRDLLRTAIQSGGITDLPDSAEAAAMAQIDALAPDDRAIVRRAAVFGITFHPRMLAWFADAESAPLDPAAWDRLRDLFDEEPDGYLRFRRSLLRDAAYEGLPYKLRRKLHGAVAAHFEEEMDYPEEAAGTLSLHYFEAGEYPSAWRYAKVAAERAESAYAYVEAAGLYSRALEAGRRVADLEPQELATVHQATGDSWDRAGEFNKSFEAYNAARPLVTGVPLAEARVLLHLSRVAGKLGNYAEALRWAQASRDLVEGLPDEDASRQYARSSARYAMVLQVEGRTTEALEWAERAAAEAEAANDPEALGDACLVMGWAYGELGKEGAMELMRRSLEAYQRAGNRVKEASLLSDLGVVSQWEGDWDEALSFYQKGREASLKIGSQSNAALARVNVAEILTDRGEWAEAEAVLLETLPFWRASQFRYFLAACLSLLGRVSLRLGRLDEALGRLDEARATFLQLGAENELPPIDARIAECRLAMGNVDGALELVNNMLGRARESNGVARVVPLLERLQGHALLQQGDLWSARDALESSLAAAKERRNLFEAALTMLSLIELDRLEGIEPPLDMVSESRSLLASLKVRAVPPVPMPPQ